jgi:hypothetical protein
VRQVTLSFDNGPDPDVTPRVLDVLASRGVTAHFFVLGKHLVDLGELVARPASARRSAVQSSAYHATCGDHWWHRKHIVLRHAKAQAGHTPWVSNVFHVWSQLHDQRWWRSGRHAHFGHRMRFQRSASSSLVDAPLRSLSLNRRGGRRIIRAWPRGSASAGAARLLALFRVLVEPRPQALLGDLDHEILVA